MLPEAAFDPEVKAFIHKHRDSNLADLLLKRPGDKNWDWLWIGQQIEGYQKAKQKIPSISSHKDIIYPKRLSLQQCSSDLTASFKAARFKGDSFLDLSGGFGIDTIHLSKNFDRAVYVEQDEELCQIMAHNCEILGLSDKIKIHNSNAEAFLKESDETFDLIYIDPARRDAAGKKVFRFSDCSPDILYMLEFLKQKGKRVLIKAAPMLDISQGVRELKYVENVYVLANSRECKELLFVLGDNVNSNPRITAVQLDSEIEFSFQPDDELLINSNLSMEGSYLYNPGAAISKSGGYKSLAQKFGLNTVHPNTHLFFSEEIHKDFPGRIYELIDIIKFGDKYDFQDKGFTIFLKNTSQDKKTVLKKYGLKEGVDEAIFVFTSTLGKQKLAVCRPIRD